MLSLLSSFYRMGSALGTRRRVIIACAPLAVAVGACGRLTRHLGQTNASLHKEVEESTVADDDLTNEQREHVRAYWRAAFPLPTEEPGLAERIVGMLDRGEYATVRLF